MSKPITILKKIIWHHCIVIVISFLFVIFTGKTLMSYAVHDDGPPVSIPNFLPDSWRISEVSVRQFLHPQNFNELFFTLDLVETFVNYNNKYASNLGPTKFFIHSLQWLIWCFSRGVLQISWIPNVYVNNTFIQCSKILVDFNFVESQGCHVFLKIIFILDTSC